MGRAEGWDDEEHDDDGNSIKHEDLEYVCVGDEFKRDSEDIRWVDMHGASCLLRAPVSYRYAAPIPG